MIVAQEAVLGQVGSGVFELVPTALVLTDTGGTVLAVNRAALALTTRGTDELVGQGLHTLFADDTSTVADALGRWQRSSTPRPAGLSLVLTGAATAPVRAAGARVPQTDTVLVQLKPQSDAVRHFAYLSRDVEVRDLRELRSRLQATLHELGRSNRRLTATNDELEQYASLISHDLRGPLSAIRQFAALLLAESDGLDDELIEMAQAIERLGEKATKVTDSLLHLARTGSFEGITGAADANRALQVALTQLGVEESDDLRIVAGRLPGVRVHEAHLIQILANLISNAVRYRAADRPLRIEVSAHVVDDWTTFVVADNGHGVAASDRDRIFRPNVRGSTVTDAEGVGLGLALCRRLVSGYGGRIELVDRDGPGAAFSFTLPTA